MVIKITDIAKELDTKRLIKVLPESDFIWDQLLLKLSRKFRIINTDIRKVYEYKDGIFSRTVGILPYSKDIETCLSANEPRIPVILRVSSKLVKGNILKLNNPSSKLVAAAISKWLGNKGGIFGKGAVDYALSKLSPDEIKPLAYKLALLNEGSVTLPSLKLELERYEGSIFRLYDSLIALNPASFKSEYLDLVRSNPVQVILASLTTLCSRTIMAHQAVKHGATYESLAQRLTCNKYSAKSSMKIAASPRFNIGHSMLLYNTLTGLSLQLITPCTEVPVEESMLFELLGFICEAGYTGK